MASCKGSALPDAKIAGLAARKAKSTRDITTAPLWFASWVGTDPAVAMPTLAARLAELKQDEEKTLFAMRFIAALIGGRRETAGSRQAYRTVEHMKALYLLMHQYIREEADINRVGGGAYSPALRDDAQDARNALFSFIRETPGKEAYLAVV